MTERLDVQNICMFQPQVPSHCQRMSRQQFFFSRDKRFRKTGGRYSGTPEERSDFHDQMTRGHRLECRQIRLATRLSPSGLSVREPPLPPPTKKIRRCSTCSPRDETKGTSAARRFPSTSNLLLPRSPPLLEHRCSARYRRFPQWPRDWG